MPSDKGKKLLKIGALLLCVAAAAAFAVLTVSAVRFGELGRVLIYGFLVMVCLEGIIVLGLSLRKRDNT